MARSASCCRNFSRPPRLTQEAPSRSISSGFSERDRAIHCYVVREDVRLAVYRLLPFWRGHPDAARPARHATDERRSPLIEKPHGNSLRISRTCPPVRSGASSSALRTGSPVIGSTRIPAFRDRGLRSLNRTPPTWTLASSKSPVRSPSLLRIEAGRTIRPCFESLTFMVEPSYP